MRIKCRACKKMSHVDEVARCPKCGSESVSKDWRRTVWIDEPTWVRVKRAAAAMTMESGDDVSLSEIVRQAVEAYLDRIEDRIEWLRREES